ncbi:hypothetical protein JIN85_01335 [Luteolibacter pohnpeiensis]|uniref:Uncharacterized protein n=1 Tax=Luteolibacter pohnpeiensis TaxID=454153 RepID=A0A934S0K1_9BACT|nr:hypothetical protein [Luteolibacter pohnpeiensis]MBK1881035.1 hypothetical protein [Luteolibacter pohnpeiensis]
MKSKGSLGALGVIVIVKLILASPLLPRNIYIFEPPLRLLGGWIVHSFIVLPIAAAKWRTMLLPASCLIVATLFGHAVVRSILRKSFTPIQWNFRQTTSVVALLLFTSSAAIAISAVAHQLVWLSTQDKITQRSGNSETTAALSIAKNLSIGIDSFQQETGRPPTTLEEVIEYLQMPDEQFRIRFDSGPKEGFLILPPASTTALTTEATPVVISPVLPESGKFIVGYSDGSANSWPARRFVKFLQSRKAAAAPPAND